MYPTIRWPNNRDTHTLNLLPELAANVMAAAPKCLPPANNMYCMYSMYSITAIGYGLCLRPSA